MGLGVGGCSQQLAEANGIWNWATGNEGAAIITHLGTKPVMGLGVGGCWRDVKFKTLAATTLLVEDI